MLEFNKREAIGLIRQLNPQWITKEQNNMM